MEKVVAYDAWPYAERITWVTNQDLIDKDFSEDIVRNNIYTKEKRSLGLKKELSLGAVSPDGRFLLFDDYPGAEGRNVFLFDLVNHSLQTVVPFGFLSPFLI
ncbi:MAG: hypothetical protein NC930_03820 [Candidatus Omnitrophica bacterium]|nr:hypothetical protein [Candidatus Omnitrophota bacterium]